MVQRGTSKESHRVHGRPRSLGERCDDITRMIDEVLADVGAREVRTTRTSSLSGADRPARGA